jgi:hypothetical protein
MDINPQNFDQLEWELEFRYSVYPVQDAEEWILAHPISANIIVTGYDEDTGEDKGVTVGKISGYRIDCDDVSYLLSLEAKTEASSDLFAAIKKIFRKNMDEETQFAFSMHQPALFIESVTLDERWRGYGSLALKATALFIKHLADGSFVFCLAHPLGENSVRETKRKRKLLRHLWFKLGITNCDKRSNIMWSLYWICPTWLLDCG